jgi:hypothetical protein
VESSDEHNLTRLAGCREHKKFIISKDSVEIPTRCSFVIEFIIPNFFEGSTCFEWYTAHHQEL